MILERRRLRFRLPADAGGFSLSNFVRVRDCLWHIMMDRGEIRVYDLDSAEVWRMEELASPRHPMHIEAEDAVAFVTGSTIRVLGARTGKTLRTIPTPRRSGLSSIAYTPNGGGQFVAGSFVYRDDETRHAVFCIDAKTGEIRRRIDGFRGPDHIVCGLDHFFVFDSHYVRLFDLHSGAEMGRVQPQDAWWGHIRFLSLNTFVFTTHSHMCVTCS